ncbi:MAG: type II secretion system protein [Patescibacteria group bacterium]|jgi:prepilin-type N-terminal cleavage/methylation domain-containing protein
MKKSGFTLIELIIAVSIIALIVSVFLANYPGSEPQSQLINATSALMRDLRLAQTKDATNINYGSSPVSGWGISLADDKLSYYLFADVNGDSVYNTSTESIVSKGGREITLPVGVIASSNDLDNSIIFYHDQDILKTDILDEDPVFSVTLIETSTGASKHVYVNNYGLIYSDL